MAAVRHFGIVMTSFKSTGVFGNIVIHECVKLSYSVLKIVSFSLFASSAAITQHNTNTQHTHYHTNYQTTVQLCRVLSYSVNGFEFCEGSIHDFIISSL